MNNLQAFGYTKEPVQRIIVTYINGTSRSWLVLILFQGGNFVGENQEQDNSLQALSDADLLSLFLCRVINRVLHSAVYI